MIIKEKIEMKSLKRERDIIIYVPDDYLTSKKRYPVLFINDGQNAFFDEEAYIGKSWGFLESIKKLQIDVILVAIYCNFEPLKREDEYGPWVMSQDLSQEFQSNRLVGGEGKAYVHFLTTELKPYIDQRFPTKIDDYGIVGSSMGALISFYAQEFVNLLKVTAISHNMLYMDVGGQEDDERYVSSNEHIKKCVEGKLKNFQYRYFPEGKHSEYHWSQRVPIFLKMFYGGK